MKIWLHEFGMIWLVDFDGMKQKTNEKLFRMSTFI